MLKRLFRYLLIGLSLVLIMTEIERNNPPVEARPIENTGNVTSLDVLSVDEIIASGLIEPLGIVNAGDNSGRLFILEKSGVIRTIRDGVLLPNPFLNINHLVNDEVERGLLGMVFHPNYEVNGHFYIFYTREPDGAIQVERYTVSSNPDAALPTSAYTILNIPHPLPIHNAGQLAFGSDGMLYIGIGDGDEQGDPNNYAQRLDILNGKILRIDVDHGSPYAIPEGNPFLGKDGLDEIWVYGLRNPWRFSFDRITGDLWIGDVGLNNWEEINFRTSTLAPGTNFGWRCKEGTHILFTDTPPCNDPLVVQAMTDPLVEYAHSEGRSVAGGYVYRGSLSSQMSGKYYYADYISGNLWSLSPNGSGGWSSPVLEIATGLFISSFGEDEKGEIYLADLAGGTIRHLAPKNVIIPDLDSSQLSASTKMADPGETVTYTIQIINSGLEITNPLFMTDPLPTGLEYVSGTLQSTSGSVDDSTDPILRWQGQLQVSTPVTITYLVKVKPGSLGSQISQAELDGDGYPRNIIKHALQIPRPSLTTTVDDFFFPGTQPGSLVEDTTHPGTCDVCHTAPIYNTWRGSMMSQAGHDPLFWSALEVANHDAPNSGEYCLRCHTPKGWLEGRSQPADGSALLSGDLAIGVSCSNCHRAIEPVLDDQDEATTRDQSIRNTLSPPVPTDHLGSAMLVIDPVDNRRGPFSLGAPLPFAYHPNITYGTNFLGKNNDDAVSQSRLCGSCHNVENPVLSWDDTKNQYWPNVNGSPAPNFQQGSLFPVETTYDEWLNSDYSSTQGVFAPEFSGSDPNGTVGACTDCHMLRSTGIAAEASFFPVHRDCQSTGCLPIHEFVGGNTWIPDVLQDIRWRLNSTDSGIVLDDTIEKTRSMLSRAASLKVDLVEESGQKIAAVRVINQTGHKLPTGYAEGRRIWINLKAFNSTGQLVFESGEYNQPTAELILDPYIKVYEVEQGITPELAGMVNLSPGKSFHFVLNNTVAKDNRIPPRGYTQTAYSRPGLIPVGAFYPDGQYWDDTTYSVPSDTTYVIVTLYYQTLSKEYMDFLKFNGGLDSQSLAEIWQGFPSPPEEIASILSPGYSFYMPSVMQAKP